MKKILLKIILILFSLPIHLTAQDMSFKGQFSGLFTVPGDSTFDETQLGLRYIPELSVSKPLTENKYIDALITLNSNTRASLNSLSGLGDNADLKTYRMWIRYASNQFETRFGLQKINFGPAKIFRSLMWFDTIDPRDPFKLTDGVNGLLVRYYFLNNANIWVWGLYGNENLKGLETVRTNKDEMEYGGRFQFPIPKGEMAFSMHHRNLDPADWATSMTGTLIDGNENRIAIDGYWDIEMGLWFEAVLGEIKIDENSKLVGEFLTVGSDYTFESGIHLLGEYFLMTAGPEIDKVVKLAELTSISGNYVLGLMDSINVMGIYNWTNKEIYSFAGWQRTYDNWQINLLAFSSGESTATSYAGNGIQFIVTYNH